MRAHMVCYGMALRSIFLTCMPQALIYHNRAKDLLKLCFRISLDILLRKKHFWYDNHIQHNLPKGCSEIAI